MKLDGVTVRVFDLDLPLAGPALDLVPDPPQPTTLAVEHRKRSVVVGVVATSGAVPGSNANPELNSNPRWAKKSSPSQRDATRLADRMCAYGACDRKAEIGILCARHRAKLRALNRKNPP
jgi:hypothetical protein